MPALKLVLLVAALVATIVSPASACMTDTATDEIAEGRLSVGRAKDAAGRPQRPYILTLPVPTCLAAADPADSVKSTRTIHLFAGTPQLQAAIARLVGKTVLVRGRPFAAHTAHHHAPIVMEILEIDSH